MAKLSAAIFLFAALLGPLAISAAGTPSFNIQGRVYCDTCRAGFVTNVTEYIEGAKVKVECKNYTTGVIEKIADGSTDKTGTYKLTVQHDGQDQICEVVLVSSPVEGCSEIDKGRDRARAVLTRNVGIADNVRFANSLGFLKSKALPICKELLKLYASDDAGEDVKEAPAASSTNFMIL